MSDASEPINPTDPEASTNTERLVRAETRQGNTEARQGTAEVRMGKGDERATDAEARLDAIEALADANMRAMREVQMLREDIAALVAKDDERGRQQKKNRRALVVAILLGALFFGSDRVNVHRFEKEAIATDKAFCNLANDNRMRINTILRYQRASQAATKQAYALALEPRPDDDEVTRQRKVELLGQLLAAVDAVPIEPDLPTGDCEGIGNRRIDFSQQSSTKGPR